MKIAVTYMPVIHRGYLDWLASTGAIQLYAIQPTDVPKFEHLTREMRALTVDELAKALQPFGYDVRAFSELRMDQLSQDTQIFVPEDDVTRSLQFDREVVWGSWFLRWDWSKATNTAFQQPSADRVVVKGDDGHAVYSAKLQELMMLARRSSDWWRQVASMVIARDGRTIVAYNKHLPNEHVLYMDGDPRDNFKPGEHVEIYTSLHGETAVIAQAAKYGVALEGAEMFVTTFPCNLCANSIAESGIKKLYFTGGYSNLNGERTLRDHGVELIFVEL